MVGAPRLVEPDGGLKDPLPILLGDAGPFALDDDAEAAVVVCNPRPVARAPWMLAFSSRLRKARRNATGRRPTTTRPVSSTVSSWPRSAKSAATLSISAWRSTFRVSSRCMAHLQHGVFRYFPVAVAVSTNCAMR